MSSRARRVRPVAVVTDSTAGLPPELVAAHRLTVVPLSVTIAGVTGREGLDVAPADVAKALVARPVSVTTSRPSPGEFAEVYDRLLGEGAAGHRAVGQADPAHGRRGDRGAGQGTYGQPGPDQAGRPGRRGGRRGRGRPGHTPPGRAGTGPGAGAAAARTAAGAHLLRVRGERRPGRACRPRPGVGRCP